MRGPKLPKDRERRGYTSMVDVVFLLLLFFLLQPFKSPELRVDAPADDRVGPDSGPPPPPDVRVRVQGAGDQVCFVVDQHRLGPSPTGLAQRVWHAAAANPSVPVVIQVDQAVHFEHVVEAFDQCRVAGMETIRFAQPRRASAVGGL